ncbi:hypothetical protein HX819_04025 [Pseudomonas sp. D6002]|uniref:hypothetical protein n=1 Tax=unclassified Pseudomonas TaxID=196821 RepID=UPI0010676C1F|nr:MULTISPECIES: hypothetical protein [unclassified Pseudomonas]MBT1265040.1 hypothetical protein [Pseudomonas sp. VS38]MDQ0668710.1 hypothetical protein [Pseudomonas sp. W2I6]NVZ95507.1 hypothetical protein [Pseudomonas sp. B6001]NWB09666.1 hypothetical protein [Pseudomonas sp. D5002]NWB13562.1 hypothetical protein [Pseudomonas sp. D6002]
MISLGFIDGNVTHDDLSILQDGAMESQVHLLKEDMLQVEYAGGLILDVGWYPSFDTHGGFRINVIRNYDWDRPVIALTAHAAGDLVDQLAVAQSAINGELRNVLRTSA